MIGLKIDINPNFYLLTLFLWNVVQSFWALLFDCYRCSIFILKNFSMSVFYSCTAADREHFIPMYFSSAPPRPKPYLNNLLFLSPRAFITIAEKKPKGLNYTALDKKRLMLFKQELVCVCFPLSIDAIMLTESMLVVYIWNSIWFHHTGMLCNEYEYSIQEHCF